MCIRLTRVPLFESADGLDYVSPSVMSVTTAVRRYQYPGTLPFSSGTFRSFSCKRSQRVAPQVLRQNPVALQWEKQKPNASLQPLAAGVGRFFSLVQASCGTHLRWNGRQDTLCVKKPGRLRQYLDLYQLLKLSNPASCAPPFSTVATTQSNEMQSARILCAGDIADELVEGLLSFGASSCTIEDANVDTPDEQKIYTRGPLPWQSERRQLWDESQILAYFPADQDVGEALAMAADSVGLTTLPQYVMERVQDNDWVQQVQDMFVPMEVAESLYIVPKWCAPPNASATNVILDPGLAFGTGDHPTTRLCLRWLHRVIKDGQRVLDYGTGSGVLALAAVKMGAERAVGVDTDPVAVSSAMYNASLNSLPENSVDILLCEPDGRDPVPAGAASRTWHTETARPVLKEDGAAGEFDVVVANILLNPLLELSARIAGYAKPGGFVGLSGILESQVDQLKEVYSEFLDEIEVSGDNGWAILEGRKIAPPLGGVQRNQPLD